MSHFYKNRNTKFFGYFRCFGFFKKSKNQKTNFYTRGLK